MNSETVNFSLQRPLKSKNLVNELTLMLKMIKTIKRFGHTLSYFCPRYNASYPCLLFEVPVRGSYCNSSQDSNPWVIPSPWVNAGPMTSFWQTDYGQRDGMSFPNLSYRSLTSALLALSPALSIAHSDEASYHVLREGPIWQGTQGGF